jgi:hypothetical protein
MCDSETDEPVCLAFFVRRLESASVFKETVVRQERMAPHPAE